MKSPTDFLFFLTLASAITFTNCGDQNAFKSVCTQEKVLDCEEEDVIEDALILLEQKRADKAIEILQKANQEDPLDYRIKSILASALAQQVEVDMISIGLAMAGVGDDDENEEDTSDNTNSITAMFAFLPAASGSNISQLELAVQHLNEIPFSERTPADNFKIVLLNTSLTSLLTKAFDLDGDGQISPVEKLSLADDSARIILAVLDSALAAISGAVADGDGSSATVANIQKIRTEIDSQEGESEAERLRNFLEKE